MVSEEDRRALARNSAMQLKAYTAKMNALDVEIAKLNRVKSATLAEAKACGFSKRILKTALRRQRQNLEERNTEEELLMIYEALCLGPLNWIRLRCNGSRSTLAMAR